MERKNNDDKMIFMMFFGFIIFITVFFISPYITSKILTSILPPSLQEGTVRNILSLPIWVAINAAVFLGMGKLGFFKLLGDKNNYTRQTSHGSADWSDIEQKRKAGHIKAKAEPIETFTLGRAAGVNDNEESRFRHSGHVVTIAPTGGGKGVSAVIPNLLTYPGSAWVLDLKGENYAVTARQRRAMGQEVRLLDPFGVTGQPSNTFNPLDLIKPDNPNVVAESAALVDMLFITNKQEAGNFWDDTAQDLMRGLLIWIATLDEDARHLGTLRHVLTGGDDLLDHTLAAMAASEEGFGVIARAANGFMSAGERVRSDVLASARRQTAFLDDPRIAAVLSQSDFDLADIKAKPMTIYLVLPPAVLKTQARFVRCFIGQILSVLTAAGQKPRHNVALFIDEFGQLGHMAAIEDAISLVRGYGVSLWLFIQDLSQLKGVYPKWQTFLANSTKQFFGTADLDTAKYVSEMLGKFTTEYQTTSHGSGAKPSVSTQFTGRSLLTPDEVMGLADRQIVLIRGENPHLLTPQNYLTDTDYAGMFDPNPYHQ